MSMLWKHRIQKLAALLAAAALGAPSVMASTNYFVDAARPNDLGDGLSWGTAKQTIQAAINLTASGDTVWVTNGTYNLTTNLVITNSITLRSVNGPAVTIVQRHTAAGNVRVLEITAAAVGAVVDGLTIRNGRTRLDDGHLGGAGIQMAAGTVTNCVIRDNTAWRQWGGGHIVFGGGIRMTGGLVVNSLVASNNTTGWFGGQGGGIWMSAGTVRGSVVTNNHAGADSEGHGGRQGGGIYMSGGLVERSHIARNDALHGGGVYMTAGTLRSSLVARNLAGGGLTMDGGAIENCTITDNRFGVRSYSGMRMTAGTVTNTIVFQNQTGALAVERTAGTFNHSMSENVVPGVGNLTSDPRFLDWAGGNYRLGFGSPAIDSGVNQAWMTGGVDLDGMPRVINATVDRGAYEDNPTDGPLRGFWEGTAPLVGVDLLNVAFNAFISGSNTTTVTYFWDFGAAGTTNGIGLSSVTRGFTSGIYTVSLTVSNSVGETFTSVRSNYVVVRPTVTAHVRPSGGTPTPPFTSWDTAAHSIEAAIDATAGTVLITNGTWNITAPIVIDRPIHVRSVNGPAVTIVQRASAAGNVRVMEITAAAAGAVVEGLTIRNGRTRLDDGHLGGAGIQMAAGTVTNCIIRDNTAHRDGTGLIVFGAGIRMTGGLVVNSLVTSNTTSGFWGGQGGGIWMSGGTVRGSVVTTNHANVQLEGNGGGRGGGIYMTGGLVERSHVATNTALHGGGVYMTAGTLRSSLVARNLGGGGLTMDGGAIENCTITDNIASPRAYSGMRMTAGTVTNTIVFQNQTGFTAVERTAGTIGFSTAENAGTLPGIGNSAVSPSFVDFAAGNFRLAPGSPSINTGTNMPWMASADARDLDGGPRIQEAIVDRGAYESAPLGGPLTVGFSGVPDVGTDSVSVVLTAIVDGSNTTGVVYFWNLGDGNTPSGADKGTVTNVYGPGLYTVSLTVTNAVGEEASFVRLAYIHVRTSATTYAALGGSHQMPFTSWATAATNIQSALDMTTTQTLIGSGVFPVTAQIVLDRPVTLRGAGPANTTIRRDSGNTRVMTITSSGAVLENVTIENGNFTGEGGGILMTGGTVRGCIIANNTAGAPGAGIRATGGLIERSIFRRNNATVNFAGSAIHATGTTTIRSCLIVGNSAFNRGGGIYADGTAVTIENCTIVGNSAGFAGGGIFLDINALSTVRNSIIVSNTAGTGGAHDIMLNANVTFSCSPALTSGAGNITAAPLFRDPGGGTPGLGWAIGDYRLLSASPCLDSGTALGWHAGALDLDGGPRTIRQVDMGAYESGPHGLVIMIR